MSNQKLPFMKSKMLWILLVLIVSLSMLGVGLFYGHHLTKEPANRMHFKIGVADPEKTQFLLTKAGADFSHNQLVLNAVVGTLVKYGQSGRIEPYLAEFWTVSDDKKIWKFNIRKGANCADGVAITAQLIRDNLERNLFEYSKSGSVIMFDHLLGWSDFQSKKEEHLSGLLASGDTLELHFDENPDDLLELLRMPYFGLWIEKDNALLSTGPYTIESNTGKNVVLALREGWFTVTQKSFKKVNVGFTSFSLENLKLESGSILKLPFYVQENKNVDSGYWISSPPTRLEAFVLSPTKNSFFKDSENRRVFLSRILSLYPNKVKSKFFYPSAQTLGLNLELLAYKKTKPQSEKLTFALERTTYSPEELQKIKEIIAFGLEDSGQQFELLEKDPSDKDWFKKTDSNNFFDSRVASVDIGAYPLYMAIKMMFCTKLGINFPDHTSAVCNLVTKGIRSGNVIDQNFIDQFNRILFDDAVVIPIFHHSDKWLVSDDLNPATLPATTLYPQFELVEMR